MATIRNLNSALHGARTRTFQTAPTGYVVNAGEECTHIPAGKSHLARGAEHRVRMGRHGYKDLPR